MKILFITRKYPPQIGGMENYSYDLIRFIQADKRVIALTKSQIHLIWFLPWAFLKALFLINKVDLIYLTDSLLAPLGLILKKISRKPVMATAHGLDITYPNPIYQKINIGSLRKLDKIIVISEQTKNECLKRNIPEEKIVLIPDGIDCTKFYDPGIKRANLERIVEKDLSDRKILVSIGRLVKRKGIKWFIGEVMPKLDRDALFLIIGDGPERNNIKQSVREANLGEKVLLLGKVSDEDLLIIYNTADIFVMPNIKVRGDMEGFGLVTLEAAAAGLPVVASSLEGVKEAISDQQNGWLVESANAEEWTKKIVRLLQDNQTRVELGRKAREYTKQNYDWPQIAELYLEEFRNVVTDQD